MKPRTWLALLLIVIPLDARAAGLDFASYLGGSAEDTCRDVAFDAAGNLYAAGGTKSPNFVTTDGTTLNPGANGAGSGAHDVWVAKFDPTGRLIWSTLIGGNGYDRAYAVEVNATGVYVAGRAGVGFPTTPGALQTAFAGDASPEAFYGPQDGFVVRLNHDGVIQWATYVGGPGLNIIRDMDIDSTGAVYAGITGDGTSPHVTAGAFDTSPGSGKNATIVKIAPSGSSAVWGTYLGGTGDDGLNPSVRVDAANGTVYVLSCGNSADFPTTPGAFRTAPFGASDLMLTAIRPDGSGLVFSTYLGGSGEDFVETHALAIRGTRLAIAAGTQSTNLATTAGVVQPSAGGNGDVILAVLGTDGSHVATSYLGGPEADTAEGVGYLADGRIVIDGLTMGRLTPGASLTWAGSPLDGFVAVLASNLTTVDHAAVIGGAREDTLRTLAVHEPTSRIGFGGLSMSTDFPVTDTSVYRSTGSNYDARDGVVGWYTLPGPDAGTVGGAGGTGATGGSGGASGSGGADGGGSSGSGSSGSGVGGSGAAGQGAAGGGGSTTRDGGSSAAAGAGATVGAASGEDSGCGCLVNGRPLRVSGQLVLLALLGLLAAARRDSRKRR